MASENGSHRAAGKQQQPLYLQYPANSSWEISLSSGETVTGTVYCTDEVSDTVFLQKNLTHTTLATELRVLHVSEITRSKSVPAGGDDGSSSSVVPLPKVQKKALEEREKRAIRMAEESFRHINEKASPEGQAVFDRLLKACNEVVWKGESVIVLNQIQVDPPYAPENCRIISSKKSGALENSSLERVKKIVAASDNNGKR
mmetsp:Transcript_5420/g.11069  ORF Transcript_5420/g.11069 Transcript_5420/m.11069 type:complete len:201 (-) Transcript_5420:35-637(-)|eukprot:scaffold34627_cov159-Amphora_coffeaeformis.AAC.2